MALHSNTWYNILHLFHIIICTIPYNITVTELTQHLATTDGYIGYKHEPLSSTRSARRLTQFLQTTTLPEWLVTGLLNFFFF